MLLEFFSWWYLKGWQEVVRDSFTMFNRVQLSFSLPVLLRTLFAPWKQIVSAPGTGQSVDEKFRVMLDNLISRTVGFFVRLFVLFTAVLMMILTAIVGLIMAIAWPVIPVLVAYCAFRGIIG